jgi:hypothetical protein
MKEPDAVKHQPPSSTADFIANACPRTAHLDRLAEGGNGEVAF